MTVDALIILAGSLVALLPFLGFPNSWDAIIFLVLGVLVVCLGIVVRRRRPNLIQKKMRAFAESLPPTGEVQHEKVAQ